MALSSQIRDWSSGRTKPDLRILAYPPEWEAGMLVRLPKIAASLASEGHPIETVDVGRHLMESIDARSGMRERLQAADQRDPGRALDDLRTLARGSLIGLLKRPLDDGLVARLLLNTGSLATLVSFSQITSEFFGYPNDLGAATVLAFPGDADERSLNLLRLRADTSYRAPRI